MRTQSASTVEPERREIRCAIYSRKSTEEGLEKEFNSLDAQREACAAYIASQRHEGWTLIPEFYDDGGYSGGSIERPAFKRLMADVVAPKVDIIVVYKVDRLTRALSDFAKIVDILDAAGSLFVSITQSFNTTTSMGRLTLNVLLSFAQFEREVISERVRDKVAASKKKGMWMGGPVPLGYNVTDRKLIVNAAEACTVRHIMSSYLRLGTVPRLVEFLTNEGIVSKVRHRRCGMKIGGTPYQRGALYNILSNQVYRGKTFHKSEIYEGEHAAIVDKKIWEDVQAQLEHNRISRCSNNHTDQNSPFTGLIIDDFGRRMKPSHAKKGSVRYRYYTSIEDVLAKNEHKGKHIRRIAAGDLETVVAGHLVELVADPIKLARLLGLPTCDSDADLFRAAIKCFKDEFADMTAQQMGENSRQIALQIVVDEHTASASLGAHEFSRRIGVSTTCATGKRIKLFTSNDIERQAHRSQLAVESGADDRPVKRDGALIALIIKAHSAQRKLLSGGRCTDPPYSDRHIARMARIAFLAPEITTSILNGTQPKVLTARRLLRASEIPLDWSVQRRVFGYKP
jgi:site-specific DNA recombinase